MYKNDLIALQDIQNYSIGVKTPEGIRLMTKEEDINKDLVYIRNIPRLEDDNEFIIKTGEYCRYIDLQIMPKMDLK